MHRLQPRVLWATLHGVVGHLQDVVLPTIVVCLSTTNRPQHGGPHRRHAKFVSQPSSAGAVVYDAWATHLADCGYELVPRVGMSHSAILRLHGFRRSDRMPLLTAAVVAPTCWEGLCLIN